MKTDQELADEIHDAARALEAACLEASQAGLVMTVDTSPRRDGGVSVWARVNRPLEARKR